MADLNRLVKDIVRLTNVEASEYAVKIDLDLEEHLPPNEKGKRR